MMKITEAEARDLLINLARQVSLSDLWQITENAGFKNITDIDKFIELVG